MNKLHAPTDTPQSTVRTQDAAYSYSVPARLPTTEDWAQAKESLSKTISGMRKRDWIVQIDLGDGTPLVVDCRSGTVKDGDKAAATPQCSLVMAPQTLSQIISGEMNPRYGMIFQRISVMGSIKDATHFCDALGNRSVVNRMGSSIQYPEPTTDIALAKSQLRKFGYTIIKDALKPEHLLRLRRRVVEQAEAERAAGIAHLESGEPGSPIQPNQRVWNLPNKGKMFVDLLDHPLVDAFMPEFLGDYYLLANHHANIAGPGGRPMYIHNDQINIQPPVDFPVGMNLFWLLDDVHEANGGTRILPGSHVPGIEPDNVFSIEGTIAAKAPAGSALIFESRLWHGTGPNRTQGKRHAIITYFVRSWVRTYENATISLRQDVLDTLTPRQKTMFGFRITAAQGSIDGQGDHKEGTFIDREAKLIPEMRPITPLPEDICLPIRMLT